MQRSSPIAKGKLIQAIQPLVARPLIARPNFLPFIFLDLAVIAADLVFHGTDGWILFALPPIFLLHVVSFLSVFWSADIASFMNYRKVRYPFIANRRMLPMREA